MKTKIKKLEQRIEELENQNYELFVDMVKQRIEELENQIKQL